MVMLTARLLLATLWVALAATLAILVGLRLRARRPGGAAGRATARFGVWWIALGIDALINQATWLAGGLGLVTAPIAAILTYAALTAVAIMLWGLASYIAFLFTGREGALTGATILYAVQYALGLAFIVSLQPIGVKTTPWGGAIAYAHEPTGLTPLVFALFFLLPPIVGAIALGTLISRARDRTHRYRLAAVSIGVFVWFTSSLIFNAAGTKGDAAALLSLATSMASMFAIVSAYAPPAFLRARGIQPFGEGDRTHVIDRAPPAARSREALMDRVRELV